MCSLVMSLHSRDYQGWGKQFAIGEADQKQIMTHS